MEEHNTSDILAQQEVIHPDHRSSTAPQSQQSEHDPYPSLAPPPSSSSSAVTDSSSPPACEEARSKEESRSVEASHEDATTHPEHPLYESLMDAAQPGNVKVQQPQTDTGAVTEQMGDTVYTGQGIVETQGKQGGGGEREEVETLKLEETEDNQEVPENTPQFDLEEDGHGVESLDVTSVSTLDDIAKRIQVEEITPAAGLVSILKRSVSLEGADSSAPAAPKPVSKRKVRFREPYEGLDHDEVGGDSWLLLLLLCLATVVISVGGTALYCTFGDAQSSVCIDFSHNMDFYIGRVQRGVDELKHWLSPSS
ncbi:Consortin [Triplophysa tibetana]|uniref:Consortin n=1 Tax=Triplophysa tibetana TaxID=1572043 RepID=A0A5A9NLK9_9TELE|nr:Consortin [Triplophysa tibetana]